MPLGEQVVVCDVPLVIGVSPSDQFQKVIDPCHGPLSSGHPWPVGYAECTRSSAIHGRQHSDGHPLALLLAVLVVVLVCLVLQPRQNRLGQVDLAPSCGRAVWLVARTSSDALRWLGLLLLFVRCCVSLDPSFDPLSPHLA